MKLRRAQVVLEKVEKLVLFSLQCVGIPHHSSPRAAISEVFDVVRRPLCCPGQWDGMFRVFSVFSGFAFETDITPTNREEIPQLSRRTETTNHTKHTKQTRNETKVGCNGPHSQKLRLTVISGRLITQTASSEHGAIIGIRGFHS
jgi:hypothetical protein